MAAGSPRRSCRGSSSRSIRRCGCGWRREDLLALERVVTGLPAEVFTAEDALGWVYQFWQSKAKDEVNASGRKIGGADLSSGDPVVHRELHGPVPAGELAGCLVGGAAPGLAAAEGLRVSAVRRGRRRRRRGRSTGGRRRVAEVTVMDPCCGSGHFLVAAFGMLWRMRAEEEGLSPAEAQDAVLRDNLFGLELDPRCTQIAMFALALEAWKQGGFRDLPTPQSRVLGSRRRRRWRTGRSSPTAMTARVRARPAACAVRGCGHVGQPDRPGPGRRGGRPGVGGLARHRTAAQTGHSPPKRAASATQPPGLRRRRSRHRPRRRLPLAPLHIDATNVPYLGSDRQNPTFASAIDVTSAARQVGLGHGNVDALHDLLMRTVALPWSRRKRGRR